MVAADIYNHRVYCSWQKLLKTNKQQQQKKPVTLNSTITKQSFAKLSFLRFFLPKMLKFYPYPTISVRSNQVNVTLI